MSPKKRKARGKQQTPPQPTTRRDELLALYEAIGGVLDTVPADLPPDDPLAQVEAGLVMALDGLRSALEPEFEGYTSFAYAVVFEDVKEADVLRSIHQLDLFASKDEADFERDRRDGLVVDGQANTPSKVVQAWMVAFGTE